MKSVIQILLVASAALFSIPGNAQDGGQIYTTYCGACHAPEGQGQVAAGIPPLAGSRWVKGDPARSIQVVLHGLMGPIEVNGKGYNSMMPAQGLVLSDDQIAAALNYIRTNWGNREKEQVTPAMVASERERTSQRQAPWEAIELLKQFPLPKEEVLFTRIAAGFSPDGVSDLKPVPSEDLPQNLLLMTAPGQPMKKDSILEFTGEITAPKADEYTLYLGSEYAYRMEVDGRKVAESAKGGSTRSPKEIRLSLEAGVYPFSLRLTRVRGDKIVFSWKSEESPVMKSLIYGEKSKAWETIELVPSGELLFYRGGSITNGGSARSISVGSPEQLHFTFDPISGSPTLLWSGRFLDAGRHWSNRGSGLESPMGRAISELGVGLAWSTELSERWPFYDVNEGDVDIRDRDLDYLGYSLDEDRLGVTFRYRVNGQEVGDHYRTEGANALLRTITHAGEKPLFLKVLEAEPSTTLPEAPPYAIDHSTSLKIEPQSAKLQYLPMEAASPKSTPRMAGLLKVEPGSETVLHYLRR